MNCVSFPGYAPAQVYILHYLKKFRGAQVYILHYVKKFRGARAPRAPIVATALCTSKKIIFAMSKHDFYYV